jgi:hypothetical protein
MNRFAAVLAGGVLLFASAAHAQDKTFSLTVTAQDLQVMSAALDELPRKISQPVVEKLQKQLIPQMQAPEPAKEPAKTDEKK